MRNLLMMFAALSLPACAGRQAIVTTPRAACADLVPKSWHDGIEAAPVPDTAPDDPNAAPAARVGLLIAAMKAWAGAYVAMNGQLDKANGRTADAMDIQHNCEAMVNTARPDSKTGR